MAATNAKIIDVPSPEEDEARDDFMDRCLNEIGGDYDDEAEAEEACELAWDERGKKQGKVRHKTQASAVHGMLFVLSDETPDRMGDVLKADGWELSNFLKNPIALFNHNPGAPIGVWDKLTVEDNQLRGRLKLAPKGTSERIDEIRKLIEAGILRATSVGFRPIESIPRRGENDQYLGEVFTKQELVETSLVSVPANPNALAIAKSLKISAATLELVFAGQGKNGRALETRSGSPAGKPKSISIRTGQAMSLAQRITDAQTRYVAARDELEEYLKQVDDSNVTDAQHERIRELNVKIAGEEKTLAVLRESERHLAGTAAAEDQQQQIQVPALRQQGRPAVAARPFSMPAKKVDPLDYLVRAGTVLALAHLQKKNVEVVRTQIAEEYPQYADEPTRVACMWLTRAATAPAMTTVTGWAAELVQTIYSNFMQTLMPKSVFPRLSSYGLSLTFGRGGRISIPTRSRTPTIAGSFVGEGQPIPVRQGAFTAQVLTPKKMGVISTWSRELDESSVPAIEGLLRTAIQEDTAVSLDSVLLDANDATAVRPRGLLFGVASQTPTAGGGFNAIVGDIKNLTGAILTGTAGNVRQLVWLMNPQQVLSAGLITAPGVGAFPFDEINRGQLRGYPVIDSGTVPVGTVILVDAADFVTAGGESPRFEISDQATLHEEDTSPAPIVGATGAVAAPVRSLWQTDSLALRLILPINWAMRRSGVVSYVAGVTW